MSGSGRNAVEPSSNVTVPKSLPYPYARTDIHCPSSKKEYLKTCRKYLPASTVKYFNFELYQNLLTSGETSLVKNWLLVVVSEGDFNNFNPPSSR